MFLKECRVYKVLKTILNQGLQGKMMFGFNTVIVQERASAEVWRQFHELGFLQVLSFILYLKNDETLVAVWNLISGGIFILLELLICYYLIFKTDWIIHKLKFTEDFLCHHQ
jgi:hypothetical protein